MPMCPVCFGSGERNVFAKRANSCTFEAIICSDCDGTGAVDAEYEARIAVGKRIRYDRLRRGLSLREEATRLGLSVVELSARERGLRPA